jgi:WD40 repeat protein
LLAKGPVIKLWDTAKGKERAALPGHQRDISAIAFSPDGQTLATGDLQGTTKLWDMASGQLLTTLAQGRFGIMSIVFTADGKTVVTSEWYGTKQWAVPSGQLIAAIDAPKAGLGSSVLIADEKGIVAGSQDGTIQVWDWASKKAGPHPLTVKGAAQIFPTPDRQVLVVRGSADGVMKLWDVAANKERGTIPPCHTWAISPDSRSIVGSSGDSGQLREWDLTTGQLKASLEGHNKTVDSFAYSADGKMLVSGGQDGKVIVWEPAARKRKTAEWLVGGAVVNVAFAPDGRHVAAINANGTAYLFRLDMPYLK